MMGPYGYGSGVYAVGGFLMMLFGLLVLIGIVLLIVWAVRQGEHRRDYSPGAHAGSGQPPAGGQQWRPTQPGMMTPTGHGGMQQRDPAVDAARERYARGEITKEQLDQIMKDLGY